MSQSKRKQLFKVIILGESAVGKTSLLNRYVKCDFTKSYRATLGADFMDKEITVDGSNVTLQIWDTAGQERFQSLGTAFYRGADCCVLVYDITNRKSFEKLESWKEEFIQQGCPKDPATFPFIVLGNKCDMPDKKVEKEQVDQWCKQNNMSHFETSALDDKNVNEAFMAVAKAASLNAVDDGPIFFPTQNVKLTKDEPRKKKEKSSCC